MTTTRYDVRCTWNGVLLVVGLMRDILPLMTNLLSCSFPLLAVATYLCCFHTAAFSSGHAAATDRYSAVRMGEGRFRQHGGAAQKGAHIIHVVLSSHRLALVIRVVYLSLTVAHARYVLS